MGARFPALRRLAALALVLAGGATTLRAQPSAVAEQLRAVRAELAGLTLPEAADFAAADRGVRAGDTIRGPVAATGSIRVDGTVLGDVFTIAGDIVVAEGGSISGNAVAIGGEIRAPRGSIAGERRIIGGALFPTPPPSAIAVIGDRMALTLGWGTIVLLIGLGVLFFGGRTLDTIDQTIDEQFGRSLVTGVLALLGAGPGLLLACVALALTILGILLIPFLVVASVLGGAGMLVLAFLASARLAGHAALGTRTASDRRAAVRALVVGVVGFTGLWLTVSLTASVPTVGPALRLITVALTGAAVSLGLGATIISRGGTQAARQPVRPRPGAAASSAASDSAAWQTPTPVAGVAAVRRPTTAPGGKS
jgi:hypothetical protein